MKKHLLPVFLIIVFSLIGLKALFHSGLFTAHDIWHQVSRLFWYTKGVSEGQFPPYWIGNLGNGYGQPLFFFTYHLPWIFAQPLLALGIQIPETIKILFLVSYTLSGLSMYALGVNLFKNRLAAFASALAFLWAPFRFLTTLVTAATGTAFSFIFVPLLFLGILKSSQEKGSKGAIILISLSLAGLSLSHLSSTISLIPLATLYTLAIFSQTKDRIAFIKRLTLGIFLGVGLSAFYLIPFIYYNNLIISPIIFLPLRKDFFLTLSQLIYSKWGYGIVGNAKEGAVSFQIGIAQWISVVFLFLLSIRSFLKKKIDPVSLSFLLGFGVSVILMLDISRELWNFLDKFFVLDYVTRFMLPTMFAGSISLGFVLTKIPKLFKIPLFVVLAFILLYTNRNHLRVNMYTYYPVSLYVDSEVTTTAFHEFLPSGADITLISSKPQHPISNKEIKTGNVKQNTRVLTFDVESPKDIQTSINHFSFPGVGVYLDGVFTSSSKDSQGRILVTIPQGKHNLKVSFEETWVIKFSKIIAALSFGILVISLFKIPKVSF